MAEKGTSKIGHIIFGERVVKQLDHLTQDIRAGLQDLSEPNFFDAIDGLVDNAWDIAPGQAGQLQTFAAHRGVRAVIVDFPPATVASVGPTPLYYPEAGKQRLLTSDIYRALVTSMASLYAYGDVRVQNGAIHNDVIFTPIGDSSAKEERMRLHVDGLYANRNKEHYPEPAMPNRNLSSDFLSFHFLRNNERVPTVVVFPDWSEMSEDTLAVLRQPILDLKKGLPPVSVLYGDPGDPWIRYVSDEEYLYNASGNGRQALQDLNEHLFARQIPIVLEAGQILLLDNRRVLHGREERESTDLPQALWRWQRRVFHSSDAKRIKTSEISSRIVDSQVIYKA